MPSSLILLNKIILVFQASVVAYGFFVAFPTDITRAAVQLVPLVVLPLTLFANSRKTKAALIVALLANTLFCLGALAVLFYAIAPGAVSARVILILFTAPFFANTFYLFKELRKPSESVKACKS